ncbi:hypothetical protein GCM10009840_17750 [Pseudolysinimonas kribbensis]|jgi:hypothetical protein|uniref:DUF2510 domain-containing protein n=1 Tax=Pseudolysinimonas kribbensis TaxID=433641 RepID=A0ABQ6K2Q9_9MICO|nr:DUF2510 domain-containing protein [Pseudolysinimonas kribbensis]GMA93843.1 hypothetical protein GCM10025881_06670 [Pseudolysinimonas kribbensis]
MSSPTTPAAAGWYPDGMGGQRYWDGARWTEHHAPAPAPVVVVRQPSNGFAVAALVLGIVGFVLMGIPLFIGWFLGGIPDILAVILGIVGIVKARELGNRGLALAIVGLCLGGVSLLSVFLGAGSVW